MTTTFEIGQTYRMRSICDHDCVWIYKVVKRTKATVTLQEIWHDGSVVETKTCRIRVFRDEEVVNPLGRYSMSPSLRATNAN